MRVLRTSRGVPNVAETSPEHMLKVQSREYRVTKVYSAEISSVYL